MQGDFRDAAQCILEDSNMPKEEYDFGLTKIFIRHPETVFSLEEARERKLYDYAVRIQEFFDCFVGSNNHFYQLRVAGNSLMKGKKERRRNSLDRAYRSDYIEFKDNNTLAAMVERYGNEGIEFGDTIFTYDHSFKPHRRIILITNEAVYLLGIVPRFPPVPPGQKKKKKNEPLNPDLIQGWYYGLHRRMALSDICSISLSQLADDYVCFHITEQHDAFIKCPKKTEMLTVLQNQKKISLNFTNEISLAMKLRKKKKTTMTQVSLIFSKGGGCMEPLPVEGVKNQWKICTPAGESPDSQPELSIKKFHIQKEKLQMAPKPSTPISSQNAHPRMSPNPPSYNSPSRPSPNSNRNRGAPSRGVPRGRGGPRGRPGPRGRGRPAPRGKPY